MLGNSEGLLDFSNFLRMLQSPPWAEMLPNPVKTELPFLIKIQAKVEAKAKKAAITLPMDSPLMPIKVLGTMRSLFEKADIDGSGALDNKELRAMLRGFRDELGVAKKGGPRVSPLGQATGGEEGEAAWAIANYGDGEV